MTQRHTPIQLALLALTAGLAGGAQAADIKAGEWDLSIGGIVNAYYTSVSCSGDTVGGLALGGKGLGCGGKGNATTVGNGLLPNVLSVGAKTRQDGYDIGGLLMVGAAVSSSDAISNNNNVDIRQGYMTFGNASMGTVKIGRDYGSFGLNAVLLDMTLLGAGAPVNATQANRVSLGHIGAGYSYAGNYGQIAYSSPATGGVTINVAALSPVNAFANASYIAANSPQLQLQAVMAFDGGKAWVGGKSQKFNGTGSTAGFTMNGVELGGSLKLGSLGLLGNFQSGKGLGVLADGDNGNQDQRATLLQATYQATDKLKAGLSWGETRLKGGAGTDLRSNTNTTLGLYHSLTKSVTLVGELSQTHSKSVAGGNAKMGGVALGGILFF